MNAFYVIFGWNQRFGPSIYRDHGMVARVTAATLDEATARAGAHYHWRFARVTGDADAVAGMEVAETI